MGYTCISSVAYLLYLNMSFPAAKGSSGHQLFISAFKLASKIICDDIFSSKVQCSFLLSESTLPDH